MTGVAVDTGSATASVGAPGSISPSRAARRRIVILTEDSKPALGGIAEYLHQLALVVSTTHDVLILTSVSGAARLNTGLPFEYRETPWFRTQWRFRGDAFAPVRRLNTLGWRLGRRRTVRETLAAIHATNPDSTYVLGRLSQVTHPWCRACRDLGLPYLVIGHGLELIEALPAVAAIRRQTDIAGAAHWFANSVDTARTLAQLQVPPRRITILRPGVVMPDVREIGDHGTAVRARYGLGTHRFVLTVSHLRFRKGVDLAIRAFAALGPASADLRYVIAGSGPEEARLRELTHALGVTDRVTFAGAVDDRDKAALMAECAVFVLSTREVAGDVEGFGIVFLEAGCYGKPVIGGKNGGVPEAVEDGVTGLLVDTSQADALGAAMQVLLDDPALSARMGRRAAERARRDFAWTERGASFAFEVDACARRLPHTLSTSASSPVLQLRRYAGTTSNRAVATAYVTSELVRRGRLAIYAGSRTSPADRATCRDAVLAWVQRAFQAGRDGGAAASYHVVHGWAAAYPEITGYLIPTLLRAADVCQSSDLSELARKAGTWLARTRLPNGAICRKQWFVGNLLPSVFNTAQVIEGWCALAAAPPTRETGDWVALARKAGDWLVAEQELDGSWIRNAFNGIPHSYYSRVAAPLATLARLTGDQRYADAARRAADWVLSRQSPSGWFTDAGFARDDAPTTHTIGYVIEGLTRCSTLLDEPRYVEAAERAARVMLELYGARGWLPGRFAAEWRPRARWRCLTGDAQIALVWCLLCERTGDPIYRTAAVAMADELRRTVRITSEWPEISGGIQGSAPAWGDYDRFAYPTHAAKFTLDLFASLDR